VRIRYLEQAQKEHTSSPTFIEFPPQLGRRTRSPAFTLGATNFPFLSWMPGPTAMTVASGRLPDVAEVGRNSPEAVFCRLVRGKKALRVGKTYSIWLEPLDEDPVEERYNRLDGFKGRSL